MTEQTLTAATARSIQPGQTIKCHVVLGLQLKGLAGGRASWLLYYRSADGTQRRPKIGDYPTMTLEMARSVARDWLERIAKGDDPSLAKKALRTAPTVADAIAEYLSAGAGHLKPRSRTEVTRNLSKHVLPHIGGKRVADLLRSDVTRLHQHVTEASGPIAANRVLAALSAVLSMCEHDDYKWRERNSNPCRDVTRNRELLRRVHVTEEQFWRVADALDALRMSYPRHVAAIYVILYAGTRVTELITAPRAALSGNTLVLDVHKTDRTGEPRIIHLPQQAVELIAALPDDGSGRLFGHIAGKESVFRIWEKARLAAGCPDVRLQDMRRTFASIALSHSGASLSQVGQLFSHRDSRTTQRYTWLTDRAGNQITQRTADVMQGLMATRPKEK